MLLGRIILRSLNAEQEKKPYGKAWTQVCPNQVWKPGTKARSFQITKGERSEKKNGGQKIGKSKFHPEIKNQLIHVNKPLVGFSGEIIWPLGQISLLVKIDDEEHSTSAWMNFMVVRSPSPYNGIIGRPGVRKIRAIPSTAHGMLKFPVAGGIVTLRSSRIIPLECSMVSKPGVPRLVIDQVTEEKIQVAIHPEYPEQTIAIGFTLTEEGRKELCGLLRRHLDVFAWKSVDMTGVPQHIAEHRLNVRERCLPVRQKKRGQTPERNKAIGKEVKKLVEADIMKEVHCHSWLSNPVMVKKHDDHWRMCMDFKDLNKACPKDGYPLPKIDWKKCTKKSDFQWFAEAEMAFKGMKQLIAELLMLTKPKEKEEDDTPDTSMEDREELPDPWILFTDGSSCINGSGASLIITNPEGMRFTYALSRANGSTNSPSKCGLKTRSQLGILPEVKKKARAVRRKAGRYAMINKVLYKKSFLGPWLRCVGPIQTNYVLREIHKGSCNMHAGPRSVVAKALRSGYYWPTMHMYARNLIRECNDCQVHRHVPRNPQENLTPITSPWPFYKWGIDIAGPFPEGPGKVKFLIVAMDYFTKWIEAMHVETITGAQSSNGDTPFSLTCEAEAVIPAKIGMPTLRTAEVDMVKNNEVLGISLDLLEEKKEQAAIQEARSKAKMERYYNARVRSTSFRPGDFFYRNNEASHAKGGCKLGPKWE
nr:reverse transcriptase domain-containing protein [Tanacetum cinerariifolium]